MTNRPMRTKLRNAALHATAIGGLIALSACGSPPPQSTSTTTQETTTTPAGPMISPATGTLQPGTPGTTTTTTTNSQTQQPGQ